MASAFPIRSRSAARKDVPAIITDSTSKKEYVVGKFLGKGAFAKCYELFDKDTNTTYAGKIISKALLVKPANEAKMVDEVQIHKTLNHPHIVSFHSCFEDEMNVYIILELCTRQSLKEMLQRRETLTEVEARYFLRQLLLACEYLAAQRIVHRDLKLGNLLLNEEMKLKVADFGLATRIGFQGERRKTLCGTPNYIAPEVLSKKGHSFEVDVWSIGCILYTMLLGRPPFVASSVQETCARIKENRYEVPVTVSSAARTLIQRMLQPKPQNRPSVAAILEDEFMTCGPLPSCLPTSCLVTPPRLDTLNITVTTDTDRRPLAEKNEEWELEATVTPLKKEEIVTPVDSLKPQPSARAEEARVPPEEAEMSSSAMRGRQRQDYLKELQRLLQKLFSEQPPERHFERPEEAEDPASLPVFWISKWVDCSENYGLAYQLCDSSMGVLFNDNTRLILLNNNMSMTYVDEDGTEHYHTLDEYPSPLAKKARLLKGLTSYMKETLANTGQDVSPRECDDLVRLPYLGMWLRTRPAICFCLTNGTVQVNFHKDHTKLILCPLMAAVTYIDTTGVFHTYRLKTLEGGCPPQLLSRLQYAQTILGKMNTLTC
ncbi:serine/threonine-protein kinase PLK1-like [Amblyomma americanum]